MAVQQMFMTIVQGRPSVALDSDLRLRCTVDLEALKIDGQPATIDKLNAASGTEQIITIAASVKQIFEFQNNHPGLDDGIFLKVFGALGLQFFPRIAEQQNDNFDISIHGTGKIVGTGANRQLKLNTGSVRLWSRTGFFNSAFFFFVTQDYPTWRETVWPEDNVDIAAIVFGAQSLAIEVVIPGGVERRRLVLVREDPDHRVWQLESCYPAKPVLDPSKILTADQILTLRRQAIEGPLETVAAFKDKFAVQDRPTLRPTAGEILYTTTRTPSNGTAIEYSRPMFDVVITDTVNDRAAVWSPQTLQKDGDTHTLHDGDYLTLLRITKDPPPADAPDAVVLTWSTASDTASVKLGATTVNPMLTCVGSQPKALAGEYLLQYGLLTPAPTRIGVDLPGWIRYQLPDAATEIAPVKIADSLSGPVPIHSDLFCDGWSLELEPAVATITTKLLTGPITTPAKTLQLAVSHVGTVTTVTLSAFQPAVTAYSPPLSTFNGTLAAPWDAPAPKTLLKPSGESALSPTSLVFVEGIADDGVSPKLTWNLTPPATATAPPTVTLNAQRGAVLSWHPYARAALIDPISEGAGNLRQTRDSETGRTIIDRDPTHGLTPWNVGKFRFQASTGPMKLLALDTPVPARLGQFSPFSLVPWVNCEDSLDSATDKRSLHYRPLALEPGEFASASQDRSPNGAPNAIAATLSDFVEAVRDPYTVAVPNLPSTPATAAEIINWAPGAGIADAQRPRVWMSLPSAGDSIEKRWPVVHLQPVAQELKVLYRDAGHAAQAKLDWLTLDLRWEGTNADQSPQFNLRATGDRQDRWQRARNGSIPLLFDDVVTTAATLGEFTTTTLSDLWLAVAEAVGRVNVRDVRAGAGLAEFATGGKIVGLFTGLVGTLRIVAAVSGGGQVNAWLFDGTKFTLHAPAMTAENAVAAAFAVFNDRLIVAMIHDVSSTLKIWEWNPAAADAADNPRRINASLPTVPVAADSRVELLTANSRLWVAVSHPTATSTVLNGAPTSGTWHFDALNFPSAQPAKEIALAWKDELFVVTVDSTGLAPIVWKRNAAALVNLETLAPGFAAVKTTLAPRTGALARPELLVGFADGKGSVEFLSVDPKDATPGPRFTTFTVQSFRAQVGTIARLQCVATNQQIGYGRGAESRNTLVSCGGDGAAKVWDVETGVLRDEVATNRLFYDNLGAVRPTGRIASPRAGVTAEFLNYPLTTDSPRGDSKAKYGDAGTIVCLSVAPNAPFRAEGGEIGIDRTDINFTCHALKLRRNTAGEWKPEQDITEFAKQANRPDLLFPVSRGDFGWYTFFAREVHNTLPGDRGLNRVPRAAGSLVRHHKLDWIKFDESTGTPDFSKPIEMQFHAALLNPLLLPPDADRDAIDRAKEVAVSSGAVVTVVLNQVTAPPSGADFSLGNVASLSASATPIAIPIAWDLTAPVSGSGALSGRLVRISAKVRLGKLPVTPTEERPRVILDVDADTSRAELLGGETKLLKPFTLAGYSTKTDFSYELLRNNPESATTLPLALDRTAREFAEATAVKALAIGAGDMLAVVLDGAVAAYDLVTGARVSQYSPVASPLDIDVGYFRAPVVVTLNGPDCEFFDPELKVSLIPGRPHPSSGLKLDGLPNVIASESSFTAAALASESAQPHIFLGEFDGRISAWNLNNGKQIATHDELTGAVSALGATTDATGTTTFVAAADALSREVVLLKATIGPEDERLDSFLTLTGGSGSRSDDERKKQFVQSVRQVSLHYVSPTALNVVACDGLKFRSWGVDDVNAPTATEGFGLDGVSSAVVGRSSDSEGVFYCVGHALNFRAKGAATSDPSIGDATGDNGIVAFGETTDQRVVVVAVTNKKTRVWTQAKSAGAWLPWTAPFELDQPKTTTRLAVSATFCAGKFQVTIGPAADPGDSIPPHAILALEVWNIDTAAPVFSHLVAGAQATAGVVLAPHAAVCRTGSNEVEIVDLRTGQKRCAITGPSGPRKARFVDVAKGMNLLLLGADNLVAFDVNRVKAYEYTHTEPLLTLEVRQTVALLAGANGALAWNSEIDPTTAPAASLVKLTGSATITDAALTSYDGHWLALLAVDSGGGTNRHFEPFDFDFTHAPTAWTAFDADNVQSFTSFSAFDEPHVAIVRGGKVEVWTLYPQGGVPAARWNVTGLTAPLRPVVWSPDQGPHLVLADGINTKAWPLSRFVRLSNYDAKAQKPKPKLTTYLEAVFTLPGGLAVEAYVAANDEAVLVARDVVPQPLRAETTFRGVYGFLGQPLAGPWGQFTLALRRLPDGTVDGVRLKEQRKHLPAAAVKIGDVAGTVTLDATADLVVLEIAPLKGNAARVVSGSVVRVFPNGDTLSFHIGEQRLEGVGGGVFNATHDMPIAGIIAQMVDSRQGVEIQGPVRLDIKWDNSILRVMPVEGVYRLAPVKITAPPDATTADVAAAREDSTLASLNLTTVDPRETYRSGFARLTIAAAGLVWQRVAVEELPFDTCFDDGIIQPIPVQPADFPQNVHRQVLGPRIRHRQLPGAILAGEPLPGEPAVTWQPTDFLIAPNPADATTQWLASPVILDTDASTYNVWEQTLAVRPGSTDDPDSNDGSNHFLRTIMLRTENLLFVGIWGTDLSRAVSSLQNSTSVVGAQLKTPDPTAVVAPPPRLLLTDDVATDLLVPLDAPGVAVHRIQCDGDAALVRIVDRPARVDWPSSTIDNATVVTLAPRDFRAEDSLYKARLLDWELLADKSQFRLQPFVPDVELDDADRVFRRYKYVDACAPAEPARAAMTARSGLFISDRTAFHRSPSPTYIPASETIFEGAQADNCFVPQALEFRVAEDKPGAVQHHSLQSMAESEIGVAMSPAAEFALREPMQLTPPKGADIEIVDPLVIDDKADGLDAQYSKRWSFKWRETLGSLPVRTLANSVKIEQPNIDGGTAPDKLPTPENVVVRFKDDKLAQCFVRINDELLNIDERQPEFPIYDARQSAWDQRALNNKDQAFDPTKVPSFTSGLGNLSANAASDGFRILASVKDNTLQLWEPARDIVAHVNPLEIPGSIGVLARVGDNTYVLSNDKGTGPGIGLHSAVGAPSIEVSPTITDAIAFAFERLNVVRAGVAVVVQAYLALTPTQIHIWTRDESAPLGTALVELTPIALPTPADPTTQMHTIAVSAAGVDTLRIAIGLDAKGGLWAGQVGVWSYDVETKTAVAFGPYATPGLAALTVGAFSDRAMLFVSLPSGVQCLNIADPKTAPILLEYQPGLPPAARLAFGATASRHIIAAVLDNTSICLWDAEQGRILRTLDGLPSDNLLNFVQLGGQLRMIIGDTGGTGAIQMYDPKFTPNRPPETFLISKIGTTLLDPITQTVFYKKTDNTQGHMDVIFTPSLLLDDRLKPGTFAHHDLSTLFTADTTPENGYTKWTWNPHGTTDTGVQWDRALNWRIAWYGELTVDGKTYFLEPTLFEPLGRKALKPTPYSSVAPKMAAVALFDSTTVGGRIERMQRTLLFGDAASAAGGSPTIVLDPDTTRPVGSLLFRYQSTDHETVDVPRLPTALEGPGYLVLLNYLVNGQVIATACAVP